MKKFGYVLFGMSGVVTYIFEVHWLFRWWGGTGLVVGFLVPPIAALFPFVYLAKEGFSILYFGIWGIGLLGLIFGGSSPKNM